MSGVHAINFKEVIRNSQQNNTTWQITGNFNGKAGDKRRSRLPHVIDLFEVVSNRGEFFLHFTKLASYIVHILF